MIKSMTGFGRGEAADEKHRITVEMKSVNHRYLDMNIKMPKKLNLFEAAMRSLLKTYVQRGKWTSTLLMRICQTAVCLSGTTDRSLENTTGILILWQRNFTWKMTCG